MSIAYYNGNFCKISDIRIPLTDRSIFFGDGIYDAAVGMNGKIYLEEEHLNRFFANARALDLEPGFNKAALSSILKELISKSGLQQYFLYFQLTRYSEERSHAYPKSERTNLLITIKEHSLPPPEARIKLITKEDVRYFMCNIKTLNLLPAVIAATKAERSGCEEAVFIRNGIVTECAHSNIFIVKNGILYTHPNGKLILPGITRGRVLLICERLGIKYKEIPFTVGDLRSADEILVTSTTKLCIPAAEVDGENVGKTENSILTPIISKMREDFFHNFL